MGLSKSFISIFMVFMILSITAFADHDINTYNTKLIEEKAKYQELDTLFRNNQDPAQEAQLKLDFTNLRVQVENLRDGAVDAIKNEGRQAEFNQISIDTTNLLTKIDTHLRAFEPQGDRDGDGVLNSNDCASLDVTKSVTVTEYADADGDGVRDNDIAVNACRGANADLGFTLNGIGLDNCPAVANPGQENTYGDARGDACEPAVPVPAAPTPNTFEEQYQDLKDQFNQYQDDYTTAKRKYNRAVDNDDSQALRRAKADLNNIDDDLDNLQNDVDDLINDVEDNRNDRDVLDNLHNLEDDISNLQGKISDLIDAATSHRDYTTENTPVMAVQSAPVVHAPAQAQVRVEPLPVVPSQSTTEATSMDSAELMPILWLIAGIVIVAGVIIFMLGMMMKK